MAKAGQTSKLWQRIERARDFVVLTSGSIALFAILWLSGALGWIEALTAAFVVGVGALAFYVGSAPAVTAHPAGTTEDDAPADTHTGFDELVSALPLPAMIIDQTDRIAVINDRARSVFRSVPATGGLAMAVIRHPELLQAITDVKGGRQADLVELNFTSDTEEVWHAQPVRLPRSGDVLVVLKDRSAVKRAERARADFLANASHELRTPLTSLAGFIETMQGTGKDDKETWGQFLGIMSEQTERMQRLIDDLLSLSSIELSEHKSPKDKVDLAAITLVMVESMRPVAADQGISISLTGPAKGLVVTAVRDELMQVVQNLVDNARKYSPENGRISVSCGIAGSADEALVNAGRVWPEAERMALLTPVSGETGGWAWFRVEDEGPGIARKHLPRLGERFYRADASRGGEIEGTGLGLAIVKHIMTHHKGGLAVESIKGKGAAFAVWLPLRMAVAPDSKTVT